MFSGPALPPNYKSNLERCDCDEEHTSSHVPKEKDSDSEDDHDSSPTPRLVDQHEHMILLTNHCSSQLGS